jgi:hypothetical protein
MKNKKNYILSILAFVGFIFGLTGQTLAATTPSLGSSSTFGILSSSYTNTTTGTTIGGDLGYTTGPALAPTVSGTTHTADATYNQAGIDQGSALTDLNSQACTFTFASGTINLSTDTTHGPVGVYTSGVYCVSGAASIGTAGITLSGSGTFIFKINGALTSVANSTVVLSGVSACDVFWTPTAATTLGANSLFAGTDLDASGITIGSTVTWAGRALAYGGTVSTNIDTITTPTCTAPAPNGGSSSTSNGASSTTSGGTGLPGTPDTGFNVSTINPWHNLAIYGLSAVSLLVLAFVAHRTAMKQS